MKTETIDMTPTWEGVLPIYLTSLMYGKAEGNCGYISVRDFAPGDRVTIRYKGLRNVLSYVVTGKECAS